MELQTMDDIYLGSSAESRLSPSSSADEELRSSPNTSSSSHESSPGLQIHTTQTINDGFSKISLSDYLPLGCLYFQTLGEPVDYSEDQTWRGISRLPQFLGCDGTPYSHVHRLIDAGWIRIFSRASIANSHWLIFRIYVLPLDVGHRSIGRQSKRLYLDLESLLTEIDVSTGAWEGHYVPEQRCKFDLWAGSDGGSLFWMFNHLPSPAPSVDLVKEKYAHEALEDLLDSNSVLPGMKTQLYPYQRRSAGLMLQRETVSTRVLDPRIEKRNAPDGSTFYFGARDLAIYRHPRYYDACRGGVLAETMGLGKTLMCLALILATKDHLALIPESCNERPTRQSVGSLTDMAISTINRKSVPWRVELERVRHATGDDMESCRQKLEQSPASYELKLEPGRWNRTTISPPPKKMTLASTTLIVVPQNLCKQWQSEIEKHVDAGALSVLVMDSGKTLIPAIDAMRSYDVILFTRNRFQMEVRDGEDHKGRRIGSTQLLCRCTYIGSTRIRDCTCIKRDELYDSPLKYLHFKRLIIDEGHFFSNTNNIAVTVANKLITADHRWIVSGTPAKDLLGVEVDMTAENLWQTPETKDSREAVLEQRRRFSKNDDVNGAAKSLGALASNFLNIMPWCTSESEEKADWEDYIYRHEDSRRRTFTSFSTSLKRTLENMVVKTRPEDVERDIALPPLSHEVVRLEPSFYDKLTANLFTLVLTANAVTSERTDVDYLFNKNSQKARSQLISNLRQSAFFWTGFSEADVAATLKSSNGYLSKEGTGCTQADRELLTETLTCVDVILGSSGWKSLSRSHELGLFIDGWPDESAEHWKFDETKSLVLTGISQLLEAQKHVNERAREADPGEGLAGAGIKALAPARYGTTQKDIDSKQLLEKPILTKAGIPTSSLDGEPLLKRRSSLTSNGGRPSPKKSSTERQFKVAKSRKTLPRRKSNTKTSDLEVNNSPNDINAIATAYQQDEDDNEDETKVSLPEDSPFLRSRIVGTTSAKLSYLISQVLKYYKQEKILVFYDGDNVAYYIAQMLELLHIKHEIYAKSLAAYKKSEYVVRFNQESQDRVLLMDVRHAAFGLNLSSASRIFFVNPVCRPNIEAQAIKRAHRIGQTRKVFVETLVLKGTIEEKMLERSKRMSRAEHSEAKALEDDGGIMEIIQSARILPIDEDQTLGHTQMASLEESQQLWGRPGWKNFTPVNTRATHVDLKKRKTPEPEDDGIVAEENDRPRKVERRTLAFVDCTRGVTESKQTRMECDDEPMIERWRRRSSTSNLRSAMSRFQDPFMPTMAFFDNNDPLFKLEPLNPPSSAVDTHLTAPSSALQFRRLPVSQLLNDEPSGADAYLDDAELIREICRRL